MKNLKLIGFLVIMASSLMFIQCTSEPIMGPQGLAGIDGAPGADGYVGVDGVDGTASCVACHNTSHRETVQATYQESGHAAGGAVAYAGGRGSCSRCHSNEGYINYITGKPAVDISSPTAVGCTTCHEKHSTFDFENDGHDYALRSMGPVTLDLTDASYVIDYGDASNNCVSCHQPRSKAPVDDGTGMYLQTSSRFYPHYGPQSTFLEGIQGAMIDGGTTAYPGAKAATHRTGASCTTCHMGAKSADNTKGLHSFNINMANCNITCHQSGVPTEVGGLAAEMSALHDKLFGLGLIKEDGSTIVQTTTIPFKTAQALWNYKTVEEDHSHGIHNPAYARYLVKNALEVLE
jgi:hypothetical protein